jgi:periplasmic divalent cation tolerance protein
MPFLGLRRIITFEKNNAMEPIFVYVTCQDREEALRIGKAVVEQRLAACANVVDGMESVYWWQGKLESSKECILIFKSQKASLDALTEAVKKRHSYSLPCVVALPILGGNGDYLSWIDQEMRPD